MKMKRQQNCWVYSVLDMHTISVACNNKAALILICLILTFNYIKRLSPCTVQSTEYRVIDSEEEIVLKTSSKWFYEEVGR